jgi:hypothetical protein
MANILTLTAAAIKMAAQAAWLKLRGKKIPKD